MRRSFFGNLVLLVAVGDEDYDRGVMKQLLNEDGEQRVYTTVVRVKD